MKIKSLDRNFIIFIGKSGCGKGTQAKLLLEFMNKNKFQNTHYISTGQLLRGFIDKYLKGKMNKHTGKIIHDSVAAGKLLPTSIASWNVMNIIINNCQQGENIILDGSPRTMIEYQLISDTIKFFNFRKPTIIYLNLSDKEATKRLMSRGRGDDVEKIVLSRLSWYKKEVDPIIRAAKKNAEYKIIEIDAKQDIESQHKEIIKKLFNIKI